ncbi:hypothetical protein LFAB_11685 [Lactiplantibacillus fabifermentans T30PCM01]|uniref:Uncharacterized protein n=1 Tax=Lactiplantibacillus fabifermentans T30PCM01 TaxID=1400520 RepID=W6T701_9LACO|nr:hypothetical protein LFAB_11685 [Lactiplantibacillus fabifermentans T30PCM01]
MLLGVTYYGDMIYIAVNFIIVIALGYLIIKWVLKKWGQKNRK